MDGIAIRINEFYSEHLRACSERRVVDIGFAEIFVPILDDIGRLYWILSDFQSSPFASGMASEEGWRRAEELRMEVDGVGSEHLTQLFAPPALQEFADYIRNDWQTFLGVKQGRDPSAATRRFVRLDDEVAFGRREWDEWMVDYAAALEEETELVFFSNDARGWEMYAADSRIADLIYNTCRELSREVRVRKLDLGQREVILSERW